MVETSARFRLSPNVVARDIAEGLMLVNVQTGSAFKLNQVGAAVWRRLDGIRDVTSIVADLEDQYRVGTERLLHDVEILLRDLREQGLIQPASGG
jgi:hypothetical protein